MLKNQSKAIQHFIKTRHMEHSRNALTGGAEEEVQHQPYFDAAQHRNFDAAQHRYFDVAQYKQ
ncbi:MAG: hypothetical protein ACJAUV_000196 [Flavobacteriales bacterium]|jgi:hypothetical protein